ncbi:MAG: hypothetical protein LBF13_03235 [Campylobacteraceae bacterium]|nr:hypothetical protein [Campylobacteraceae bacterium]
MRKVFLLHIFENMIQGLVFCAVKLLRRKLLAMMGAENGFGIFPKPYTVKKIKKGLISFSIFLFAPL